MGSKQIQFRFRSEFNNHNDTMRKKEIAAAISACIEHSRSEHEKQQKTKRKQISLAEMFVLIFKDVLESTFVSYEVDFELSFKRYVL